MVQLQKIKPLRLNQTSLELLLMAAVSLLLLIWFSGRFELPTQQPDSMFYQTHWVGQIDLPRPPTNYSREMCAQLLSPNTNEQPIVSLSNVTHDPAKDPQTGDTGVLQQCQTLYPDQVPLLEKLHQAELRRLPSPEQLHQQQETSFGNAQLAYRGLVQTDDMPSDIWQRLQQQHDLTPQGSVALYCSWYALEHLAQAVSSNSTQAKHLTLARNELLTGGYAPYRNFGDRRNVQAESVFGRNLLAQNTWQSLGTTAQANCQHLAESPAEVYLAAMHSLEILYEEQDAYDKTAKLDHLSQSAHWYLIGLVWLCYASLWISRGLFSSYYLAAVALTGIWALGYIWVQYSLFPRLLSGALAGLPYWAWVFVLPAFAVLVGKLFDLLQPKQQVLQPLKLTATHALSYPLMVLLLGVGYFVLVDWSLLSGYRSLRFVALYQSEYLFIFFLLLSYSALWSRSLFALLGSIANMLYAPIRRLNRRQQRIKAIKVKITHPNATQRTRALAQTLGQTLLQMLWWVTVVVGLLFGLLVVLGQNQITSEVFRLLFVLLVAYVCSQRSVQEQRSWGNPALWVLLGLFGVVLALQVVTSDLGPAMVLLYAVAVLLVTQMAVLVQKKQPVHINASLWTQSKPLWIWAGVAVAVMLLIAVGLQWLASLPSQTRSAERVLSMQHPFASTNDQKAMLWYFLSAAPPEGYGLGNTPWQGDFRSVPAQTQSDYMPMALYAVLGRWGLVGLLGCYVLWLLSLLRPYWGEAGHRLAAQYSLEAQQREAFYTFFAWLAVLWVLLLLVQLSLTVFGNFGLTPLTGISLPLFSYGRIGLWSAALLLGLLLQRWVSLVVTYR